MRLTSTNHLAALVFLSRTPTRDSRKRKGHIAAGLRVRAPTLRQIGLRFVGAFVGLIAVKYQYVTCYSDTPT